MSAYLVQPAGPHQPRQSTPVGGRQMEGEVVGLAHLNGLLEQVIPGVYRAAEEHRCPSKLQDVSAGRRILALLSEPE
jgi:hypothetical protein